MTDANLLKLVVADMHKDVLNMNKVSAHKLVGGDSDDCVVEIANAQQTSVAQSLTFLLRDNAPLWELQYAFLVCVYLSDTIVQALCQGTHPKIISVWLDGCENTSIDAFRKRFECHLLGVYAPKEKKGSRKNVIKTATTPHQEAANEYLLLHMILGNH